MFSQSFLLTLLPVIGLIPRIHGQVFTPPSHTPCNDGDIALGQSQTCGWFPQGPPNQGSWPDCGGNFGNIWDDKYKALSTSWKEGICNGDWTESGTYVHCENDKVVVAYVGPSKAEYLDCYKPQNGHFQYQGPLVKTTLDVQWCCVPFAKARPPHTPGGHRRALRQALAEKAGA